MVDNLKNISTRFQCFKMNAVIITVISDRPSDIITANSVNKLKDRYFKVSCKRIDNLVLKAKQTCKPSISNYDKHTLSLTL